MLINGPRCVIRGHRIHHGTTGIVIATVAAITRHWSICALGLALTLDDLHDRRVWLPDLIRHG